MVHGLSTTFDKDKSGMPDRKASPKELEPKTSLPLPFETGPDKISPPETSLKGDQTVVWDRALLRPFVPRGKLNAQPSEAEIFKNSLLKERHICFIKELRKKEIPNCNLAGFFSSSSKAIIITWFKTSIGANNS